MFDNYVFEKSSAQYSNKILLLDDDQLDEITGYSAGFLSNGFEVVKFKDDLSFRLEWEDKVKDIEKKIVVIANSGSYIPYDMWRRMRGYTISFSKLFPKLNPEIFENKTKVDLDLICLAYQNVFDDLQKKSDTDFFMRMQVYSQSNIKLYLQEQFKIVYELATNAKKYNEWFEVAEKKAVIDVLSAQYGLDINTDEINDYYTQYVMQDFGKLSQALDKDSPVLVSKVMDYINDKSSRHVLIVMDGMSEFDWNIIEKSFFNLQYKKTSVMAMIPTTTSISRQCLLANKYPAQLISPWNQSKEKHEFIECAKNLGFNDSQISYCRGYEVELNQVVRCAAIIINDVDDLVHAQQQGRNGMYNDITLLAKQKKLVNLTRKILSEGYDVFITADHGNTPCTGLGKYMGAGLEIETKSRRMMVLKDFADKAKIVDKYAMIDYPKYYLSKEYDYLICESGTSLDSKNDEVMSHGGITIDEVVVPFITLKAEDYNG